MTRWLLRLIGFVMLAAAFAALIVDGTRSIAAGHATAFAMADTVDWLLPGRLAVLTANDGPHDGATARILAPVLTQALRLPTWLVVGGIACLLLLAGRRRSTGLDDRG